MSAREPLWQDRDQEKTQAPGAAGAASDRAYVKTRSSAGKRDVGGRSGAAENHHRGDERLLAFQNGGQECHRSLQVLTAGLGCLRSLWRRVCPGNVAHAGQLGCICPTGPIFCECTHSLHIWGGACQQQLLLATLPDTAACLPATFPFAPRPRIAVRFVIVVRSVHASVASPVSSVPFPLCMSLSLRLLLL